MHTEHRNTRATHSNTQDGNTQDSGTGIQSRAAERQGTAPGEAHSGTGSRESKATDHRGEKLTTGQGTGPGRALARDRGNTE